MSSECKEAVEPAQAEAKGRTGRWGRESWWRGQSQDTDQRMLAKSGIAGLGSEQPQSPSAYVGIILLLPFTRLWALAWE